VNTRHESHIWSSYLADYFELRNHGTSAGGEILAGVTTFVSAMYIIVVNPAILSSAGLPFNASLTATVLVAAFSSIMMGLYTNNPFLVAPGMSLNSMLALAVSQSEGVSYETGLGCVFLAGVVFLLLLLIDRKKRLIQGIPRMLRFGFAGGIGLFIALIGMESGGFIIPHSGLGLKLGVFTPMSVTFLAGLAVTSILVVRKVRGGFLWGVGITTILAWPIGRLWTGAGLAGETVLKPVVVWTGWAAAPDFSLLLQLDIAGAASLAHWPLIFVLIFSCLFDSLATCVGVSEAGDLVDHKGNPRHLTRSLKVCALSVAGAGLLGTSPGTAFIESSTGVRTGGRTGLTAVVAGLCFLPFMFLSPLLSLIPSLATAPILVLAGVFMLKPLIYVRWERFDEAIPFFMAMILMPLTHSITQGIIWGCLSWTLLKLATGKYRQITLSLILLDVVAVILLFHLERLGH